MKVRYKILKTFEQVKELVEHCKQTGNASIDFETRADGPDGPQISSDDKKPTGPAYKEDEPTIISIVFQPGALYCVPLFHKDSPFTRTEADTILKYIGRHIIENPSITKWAWNLKFEYRWFLRYGITPKGRLMDVMGLKYMLNEERPNGLKEFCEENIPEYAGYDTEIIDLRKKVRGWANIPLKPLAKYCCIDSDITLRIGIALERMCIKEGFYLLFRNMFMMQTRVLAESESMGMPVDREYLTELVKTQKKRIEVNEKKLLAHPKIKKFQRWRIRQKIKKLIQECQVEISEIKKEAHQSEDPKVHASALRKIKNREDKITRYVQGELATKKERVEQFNPNSPPQLVDLLYRAPGGFNFKIIKYTLNKETKQPTTTPSTAEDVLLVLKRKDKSGFIDRLLNNREMSKLYSTYMVAPLYRLTPGNTLHSSFLIMGTVCVSQGTRIVGKEGSIRVGDLIPQKMGIKNISNLGLKALTHKGNFKLITQAVNKGYHPMVEIHDSLGNKLECTPGHKLMTVEGWKSVKECIERKLTIGTWKLPLLKKPPLVAKPKKEVLKPIPGWEGYFISNWGIVYSSRKNKSLYPMKARITKGYNRVAFRPRGLRKKINFKVSSLVAKVFLGEIPEGYCIDHRNCNKLDDWSTNLRYLTRSYNIKRAFRYNLNSFTWGEMNGGTKIDIPTVLRIRSLYREGRFQREIGELLGLGQVHVGRIVRLEAWKYIQESTIVFYKSLGKQLVCDLTVEDDASYVTDSGFINHNTGRLSSKNINMQNIPRSTTSALIKKMFIPPKNHLLLEVDYGQAELRVVAELAKCKALIEIFRMGYNVHLATGLKIIKEFDKYEKVKKILKDADHPENTKWEKIKKRGKVLNFSILYLQSDEMTAEQMDCSVQEAAQFKADWFAAFPEIKRWMERQEKFLIANGYVRNMFGRLRRLPDIWSDVKGKKNAAIREGINAPIQGASSDFTQFATIIIRERILDGTLKLSDDPRWQSQAYTVHDSIGFYVEPKYLHKAAAAITAICSDPETMKYFGFEMKYVKMKVSPEVGITWGDLRDYEPNEDYETVMRQAT